MPSVRFSIGKKRLVVDGIPTYYYQGDYLVSDEVVVVWDLGGVSGSTTLPKHFKTDKASIPRVLWSVFPPDGAHGNAAILHDYFYRTPGSVQTRSLADYVFLTAMRASGVPYWKALVFYGAVRLFGRRAWRNGRQ